jgi:tRNA pseudouridine55 synthase
VSALPQFTGDIRQVPPQFSAVKVDGNRAYDIARSGETMELAARDLYVDELSLLSCPDTDHATFRFVCGSGGYVRSIARDLGETLGCLGHVVTLRRTWVGAFDIEDAVTLDEIERLAKSPEIDTLLHPVSPSASPTCRNCARPRRARRGCATAIPGTCCRARSNTAISPGPPSTGSRSP